jgi:site-specific recombinase XerD
MMPRPKLHPKFKGIAPKTARAYRKEIYRFFQYLSSEEVEIPSDVSLLDFLVSEYINVLYQEGDSISQAGWLLSGLKRFIPKLRFRLPTSQQYYNNWLRDHVPMRAVPMPWL